MNKAAVEKLRARVLHSISTDASGTAGCSYEDLCQFASCTVEALPDPVMRMLASHFGLDMHGHFNGKRVTR